MSQIRNDPTKVVSGKHIIFTHFPKDRHLDVCLRTRMTRTPGRRQDALAKQYLEQKSLEVTESSARRANLETITDTQSWYKIFSLRGFQSYPCRTKNFSGDGKEFKKVSRAVVGILANLVKIFHGIIELRRPRSETKGIAERVARRVQEGTSAVLLQSGLEEKCGADSLRNAIALCEMSKASWQPGKSHLKEDSENQTKCPIFLLAQWLNVIRFLQETSRGSSNLARKFCQGYSSDMH